MDLTCADHLESKNCCQFQVDEQGLQLMRRGQIMKSFGRMKFLK